MHVTSMDCLYKSVELFVLFASSHLLITQSPHHINLPSSLASQFQMSETPSQQTTDASTDKPSSVTGGDKPRVLIVGAGLAGLMLALLLEKINIPYQVFERASKIRPLGSALSLGANILPVFEQLGMLQDIIDISYPVLSQVLYDANMKQIGKMSMKDYKGVTGYDTLVFARPQLHELMLSRVPAEKVLMNKKVLSIEQNQLGAMIRCNDNTQYHGDIIVGADGAYSGVRQALYKRLEAKGMLPKSDAESLEAGFITMVGTTDPMDPERYPCLKEPVVDFSVVIGGQHLSWVTLTLPNNRVGWGVAIQFATPEEAKEVQFRNSEWGPEAIEEMIGRFRDRKLPIGGTIGDLIDATPKDLISKVYLDEKMFETWHHGRTVLIGDACHKMLLSAGQGAINAMQDSVILANAIYDLKSSNPDELKEAFQSYQTQRYPHAKFQYMNSKMVSKLMTGQKLSERMMRSVAFNYLPDWVIMRGFIKSSSYRPQAVFLPLVENRGSCKVLPQEPSRRAEEEKAATSI